MTKTLQAYDLDVRSITCAKSCWLRFLMILSLSLFGNGKAVCQNGFQILPELTEFFRPNLDDINFHQDHLWINGNYYNDSLSLWVMFVAKMDTTGNVIWTQTHFDTSKQSFIISNTPTRLTITDRNHLILPQSFFQGRNLGLFVLDSLGQLLHLGKYDEGDELVYFSMDVKKVFNNFYLTGIVTRPTYDHDIYVIKTDSTGRKIWDKKYGQTFNHEVYGDAIVNDNGTLTISSFRCDDDYWDDVSKGWIKPWLFTIDTSGQIIDQWLGEENDERTFGGESILQMTNGDWIMVSTEYQKCEFPPNTVNCTSPTVTRLDSNYNLLWKVYLTDYTHPFDEIVDMEYDSVRNQLIVAGRRVAFNSSVPVGIEAWVAKLSADGEILWSESDTIIQDDENGVELYTAGVDISPSGSIYLAGYLIHYIDPAQVNPWIIKVTPDGCMDTLCTTTSILDQIEKQNKNVYLYPNPADGDFNIHIKDLMGNGKLNIFDLQGQLMLSESVYEGDNHVDVEVPHGLYLYLVRDDGQMIGSGKVVLQR